MIYSRTLLLPAAFLGLVFGRGATASARTIKPCVPGEPAQVMAAEELAAIDVAVRSLAPGDNPKTLSARIEAIGRSKCFQTIGELGLDAKDGLSLRTYWEEGGFNRLQATLKLGDKGKRMFWTEPSVRRSLTTETAPTSPIAGMLCPANDEACGAETSVWVLRANQLFALAGTTNERPHGDVNCESVARVAPRRRQFAVWRDCFEASHEESTSRIPIGYTRAPKQGWLVVTGRRGHYDFCDEIRAYDLATGSAYVLGSCAALALEANGTVNRKATDDARKTRIEIGHLPIDYLREAVWMMVLRDEMDEDVRSGAVGTVVPEWLQVSIDTRDERSGIVQCGASGGSTAQNTLDWEIVGGDRLHKRGTLTFPFALHDIAADHAVHLLRIAELKFATGCPEAAIPVSLVKEGARNETGFKELWAQAFAKHATCRTKK